VAGKSARSATHGEALERTAIRLTEVEELLEARLSPMRVEATLSQRWGVTQRCVRRYVRAVRRRWRVESRSMDRTARRDQMRSTIEGILYDARQSGDLTQALRAADMLVRLDGLDAPIEVDVRHSQAEPAMAPEEAEAKLVAIRGGKP
jgi:hypothetical protein